MLVVIFFLNYHIVYDLYQIQNEAVGTSVANYSKRIY